ncbi:MAG: VWA domain-containing protein [Bacteroidales bacterium]
MNHIRKFMILGYLLLWLFPNMVFATKTLVFAVDVSGSMKQSGIYKAVVSSLIIFIKNEYREGDNLVLCSFGSSFYRNKDLFQGDTTQMKGFLYEIEKLNFTDDWTYMTLAFKELAELTDNIRREYPDNPVYIYLYTDGKNEPPPYVSNPLTFGQIMEWYFGSYKNPHTYLYIITLGVKPEPDLDTFATKVDAKIIEVPPKGPVPVPKPPLLPIEITPQKIFYKSTSKSGTIEIYLKYINKNDLEPIEVKASIGNFNISPKEFIISKGENNIKFRIDYKDLSIKTHRALLTFSSQNSDIMFKPDKISVEITIYSLLPWFIAGVIVLILIFFLLRFLSIPKFPRAYLVYLDESGNVMRRFNLRSHQKFGSNRLRISDDLDVQGIGYNSLELIAESGGAVALKVLAKDKKAVFSTSGEELGFGERRSLFPGDEFEFTGIRLRYEKGG